MKTERKMLYKILEELFEDFRAIKSIVIYDICI